MTFHGMRHPFGQLESAVLPVSPPSFQCNPSLFTGGKEWNVEKALMLCKHCSAATAICLCYQNCFQHKSKLQPHTSYWEENYLNLHPLCYIVYKLVRSCTIKSKSRFRHLPIFSRATCNPWPHYLRVYSFLISKNFLITLGKATNRILWCTSMSILFTQACSRYWEVLTTRHKTSTSQKKEKDLFFISSTNWLLEEKLKKK